MKSVLKKHIVSEVAEDTGYSKVSVSKIFDAIMSEVMFQVSNGHKVRIKGFGTFEPKHRAARTGRNPHTDTPVHIPPTTVPFFTPGEQFKDYVKRLGGK